MESLPPGEPQAGVVCHGEPLRDRYDAVVIGSGPNGLAAAITLAGAGRSVLLVEAAATIGGGMRSASVTLPGFVHDICSAIHPLAALSPFFRSLPLGDYGVEWLSSPLSVAHPLPDGRAATASIDLASSVSSLGDDADAYRRLVEPYVARVEPIFDQILSPLQLPRHPLLLARLGLQGLRSAERLTAGWFQEDLAPALFAGMAAHSILPLERPLTAAVALMFAISAHAGWPFPRGGSQSLADALGRYFNSLGGEIVTNWRIETLDQLPAARSVFFDLTPRQIDRIAGDALPPGYRRKLQRYRHGPGSFKIDWALDGPIPWRAAECAGAATVHVGGTFAEVAAAERAAWRGETAERPFVLVAQTSLFDATRAPAGKHTGWAYCHVPHGSTVDMTDAIENQMERFAPGFRERILHRCVMPPAALERYNENYLGGDITAGVMDFPQLIARPVARLVPYATPNPKLFICSASTPPGPGVHGMCGYHAAQAALRKALRDAGSRRLS